MRKFYIILTLGIVAALTGCGNLGAGNRSAGHSSAAAKGAKPEYYTYRTTAEHPHLTTSYTQGLQFVDGVMWEGTGQHGQSKLQRIDLETGAAEVVAELPQREFGEGITVLGDKVYQLTWTSNVVHIYDRTTGRKLKDVHYPGEGWGLTTDGQMLYMSNGTSRIFRIDPETFERKSSFTVTVNGEPVNFLNELEWIDGRIWANVYTLDRIVIIDPASGVVEGIADLAGLLPESERTPETDVLNGIAYDKESGRIFVTGKNWSKIFEIELIKR